MSKIQWTDTTWNPVTGCSKVSQGCKNCYAERIADRFWGTRKFTDVQCHPDRVQQPMYWKKPRRVFVNSMSDLFHESVPFEFIQDVWAVMAQVDDCVFQVLTKRPERMKEVVERIDLGDLSGPLSWPLKNVWLGVSVENQEWADKRIPILLQTPAAVHWVSAEPLISRVDLRPYLYRGIRVSDDLGKTSEHDWPYLNWVVVGGESGLLKDVRPFNIDWAREIIRDCKAAGCPVFIKQLGSHAVKTDIKGRYKMLDKKGGYMNEWPEDLRVREYPPTTEETEVS